MKGRNTLLIRMPILKWRGLSRLGNSQWQSQDNDPQIIVYPKLFRAHYIIICVTTNNTLIDPCLYIDTGNGFEPDEEIQLPTADTAIYILNLQGSENIRKIRFDPATFQSIFAIRIYNAYDETATRAFIGKEIQKHHANNINM